MTLSTTTTDPGRVSRRTCLRALGIACASALVVPIEALAAGVSTRSLSFVHTHTHETLSIVYRVGGEYVSSSLGRLQQYLRDHYTGAEHPIEPALYDLLHAISTSANTPGPFHVISAYRSPETNARLRARSGGVASHSLHMDGKAIDIRLPGLPLPALREHARALGRGGVGFYPGSNFVHVDTGRVRAW
jgi:uncharacterized protein YcbK (DUF882 family)